MKVKDFEPKVRIDQPLLIVSTKEGKTNAGNPYVTINLRDNSGAIDGKLWDVKPEQLAILQVGEVINVKADVIPYQGNLQLKVMEVEKVDINSVDLNELVVCGPIELNTMEMMVEDYIESINNYDLHLLVGTIYHDYLDKFYSAPAATRNHHEYRGGLATHVIEMLQLADKICQLYPNLNRDLLISGVLMHDIGKIIELSDGAVAKYTTEGRLLGHISISQTIIKETADRLGLDSEEVLLLRHMVLAHHGKYEYGSPVLPLTVEAEVLHFIDDFDAKMTILNKEMENVKPGEFSGRIIAMDGRNFYKPLKGDENE